ncbi:hypothetical protein L484_016245 [Morus notabilis]|uniref:Uncharacterized protein n=1 Tax=Morus notabilis TaxID=981085 RepID=W9R2Y1_9ROSA|nr:hypothetical protein L484_016245 [Morus notabilis]
MAAFKATEKDNKEAGMRVATNVVEPDLFDVDLKQDLKCFDITYEVNRMSPPIDVSYKKIVDRKVNWMLEAPHTNTEEVNTIAQESYIKTETEMSEVTKAINYVL